MRLKLHVSIIILHAEIIMWHVNKYVYITMLHLNIINTPKVNKSVQLRGAKN